jgi:MYXO-CTERM domain-containing protein
MISSGWTNITPGAAGAAGGTTVIEPPQTKDNGGCSCSTVGASDANQYSNSPIWLSVLALAFAGRRRKTAKK